MIRFHPVDFLRKIAPARKIDKLMSNRLTLNKAVLSFLDDVDFISVAAVERTALKTIKEYRSKYQDEKASGISTEEAKQEATNHNKLLIHRVQNLIVHKISQEIKDQYRGEFYKWLPSDAAKPDPIHQLNYGKTFQIGKGEMPGDRYGCRCGMNIQVSESKLDL